MSGTATSFNGNVDKDELLKFSEHQRKELTFVNQHVLKDYNPDINGYTLCFMVPPLLSGLDSNSRYEEFSKLIAFAAIDFSPPVIQTVSSSVSLRVGAIPYASEVLPSEQCSVTFIDTHEMDIFKFHLGWIQYIKELVEGRISPDSSFYKGDMEDDTSNYFALDYVGSLFFVRYDASFTDIKYVGKATGIFPQNIPSKELLGQRTANELTTLSFTYYSAYYEEWNNGNGVEDVFSELEQILSNYYG